MDVSMCRVLVLIMFEDVTEMGKRKCLNIIPAFCIVFCIILYNGFMSLSVCCSQEIKI